MINKRVKIIMSTISPRITSYLIYWYNFGKILNLKNPQSINEKLQYLKLKTYYKNPTITKCVDKYLVRFYLEERKISVLLPNLIAGGYENAEEIKKHWTEYPDKFVIKCNHGCGYNILVKNKYEEDIDSIIKQLNLWIKEDYWKIYCEPQYKYVNKRIHIEEYLGDEIQTYKFYCFNGKPEVTYVSSNGENGEKDLYLDYYDMEWKWLPISLENHKHSRCIIEKPINLDKMIDISKKLSEKFPFVRVDLYNINGDIYFSELTFIPTGGIMKLNPKEIIDDWGNKLNIKGNRDYY